MSATLFMTIYNPGNTVEVRGVLEVWTEAGVTFNASPNTGTSAQTSFSGASTGEIAVDITGLAQQWVDTGALFGIQLWPTGSDGVDLRSSEYGTSGLRPYFVFDVID